jgi:hypothetical protein
MNIDNIISELRSQIDSTRSTLFDWCNASDSVLDYKPIDAGWTSRQILEHVMLTSHYLLLLIDKGAIKAKQRSMSTKVDVNWDSYSLLPPKLEDIGKHKSFSWIRPEHMEPKGSVSIAVIKATLQAQFHRCEYWLEMLPAGEGVLCLTTMTVNGIGKLDVYQYIYFLVLHAKRHLTQIANNKREFFKNDE